MAARRAGSCALRWLPPSVLLLLTVLFSASPPARALRFDLESGHTKCISDEIKVGSMAVGKYHVVDPNPNSPDSQLPDSHRISLRVSQVDGGGNAEPEQANKLKDGLAWVPLTRYLLIRGRVAAVASEDLFREKEAAVVLQ